MIVWRYYIEKSICIPHFFHPFLLMGGFWFIQWYFNCTYSNKKPKCYNSSWTLCPENRTKQSLARKTVFPSRKNWFQPNIKIRPFAKLGSRIFLKSSLMGYQSRWRHYIRTSKWGFSGEKGNRYLAPWYSAGSSLHVEQYSLPSQVKRHPCTLIAWLCQAWKKLGQQWFNRNFISNVGLNLE